ncbi:MAG: dipeptidase [Gammaproteobacteria bacterium]|nr:dipeptidase [Gammaproteobacteria bacterium]MDH4313882.1 dipeptidase [Gammaproteobacteria bacterium]MDH5215024.1 dipeptidase [Gammaproteobacteria bacterium]
MNFRSMTASLLVLAIAACGSPEKEPAAEAAAGNITARAQDIAKKSIIIDTHIDVPYRLEEKWEDVTKATESGDYDYPRAVAGGLNAPFMSIYTPAELEAEGRSKGVAEELIDLVEKIVASNPAKHAIARSPDDVEEQFRRGIVSLPLGMENGSPIEGDLANLRHFYDRGIRYVTLAHGLSNHISDSSYDDNRQWGGLSEFGVEVVAEMNRLGILVDISHVSDEAFWDVMEVTKAPAIASHSSARHFTPGWERNMADDMIVRLAQNGGVIMINFGSAFISQAAWEYGTARREAYAEYREANQLEASDDLEKSFNEKYASEHGEYPFATLDQVLDHFDHVVKLTSVSNVGIGSDYDGVGDSLPIGLKDVSSYPNLVAGLLRRGYSEEDIRKILGGNLLRVWREVEAVATTL